MQSSQSEPQSQVEQAMWSNIDGIEHGSTTGKRALELGPTEQRVQQDSHFSTETEQ